NVEWRVWIADPAIRGRRPAADRSLDAGDDGNGAAGGRQRGEVARDGVQHVPHGVCQMSGGDVEGVASATQDDLRRATRFLGHDVSLIPLAADARNVEAGVENTLPVRPP